MPSVAFRAARGGMRDAYPIPETLWLVNDGFCSFEVFWSGLEKRSQALLGSNLTRDIQADGAPSAIGPLGIAWGPFDLKTPWTPEPCLKKSIC